MKSNDDNPRIFVPPPLIFLGLPLLGLTVDRQPFTLNVQAVAAILLTGSGIVLIGLAIGLFRKSGTRPEPWQPASALVMAGIYRRTRNPMYLGMALISVAIGLAFNSLFALILSAIAILLVDRLVIAREEAYLTRRFRQSYVDYRGRVRRWL